MTPLTRVKFSLALLPASVIIAYLAFYAQKLPSSTTQQETKEWPDNRPVPASTADISSPGIITISNNTGLPAYSKGGANGINSKFHFWGRNWSWSGLSHKNEALDASNLLIKSRNKALDFNIHQMVRIDETGSIEWTYTLDAEKNHEGVVGGGVEYKFDLKRFGQEYGEPKLLDNNQGWSWGRTRDNSITLKFSPPLPKIFFERNNKSQIRAFFYSGSISEGKKKYTASLTLPTNIQIKKPESLINTGSDGNAWVQIPNNWQDTSIDLSFLNQEDIPAGRRGFIKANKDKLEFADGSEARFWGTNISALTIFRTPKQEVKKQAKALSRLGFNLARFHHHDSPWVNPNIFGENTRDSSSTLDETSLEKLDWWIKCLKDEGIYTWLDLHVQRKLKDKDKIDSYPEIKSKKDNLKGFNYVNNSIRSAMIQTTKQLLTRKNIYTGLKYADEPAIIAVLITNENDVTHHFGNKLLNDKGVPEHNAWYMKQSDEFSDNWDLPANRTWRSWEHGPSKLFLNDLENHFNDSMISAIKETGYPGLITTTSTWGWNPLSSLPALTMGDMVDAHAYGGVGELNKNPLIADNMMHWLSSAQVAGMPMSVTEWNISPFPAPDRHLIPIYIASNAAHQGWDAVMQYAYAQVPLNKDGKTRTSNWDAFNDPSLLSTFPAAALLFRNKHVTEAESIYQFAPSSQDLFYKDISARNLASLRTASEKGKLIISIPETRELPWLSPRIINEGVQSFNLEKLSFADINSESLTSDNNQLTRNWDQGTFLIDTPKTQAMTGNIGSRTIELSGVKATLETELLSLAVQSLTDQPILNSDHILISIGSHSRPSPGNRTPFSILAVRGTILIKAKQGLTLTKRKSKSNRSNIPFSYSDGTYRIQLDGKRPVSWLELRKATED
jgi:hypothetical protein